MSLIFLTRDNRIFYDGPYNQDLQVGVLKALLKHLNLKDKKITLMGISYGGEVAMRFALESPKVIDALILSNTTAYTNKQLKIIGDSWIDVAKSYNGRAFSKSPFRLFILLIFMKKTMNG